MFLLLFALAWAASTSVVHLHDGRSITGVVTFNADGSLTVQLADGSTVQLQPGAVARVVPVDQPVSEAVSRPSRREPSSPANPHAGTGFYAPSGLSPSRGTGTLAQKELAGTLLTYGVTDELSVQVGTVAPLAFTSAHPWMLGGRWSAKAGERVRAGVGLQAFSVSDVGFGAVTGHVSFGRSGSNVTVHLGAAGAYAWDELSLAPMAVLATNHELGDHVALLSETHLYGMAVLDVPLLATPAVGVRFFGPRWAVDAGVLALLGEDVAVPLPILSFQWAFDRED